MWTGHATCFLEPEGLRKSVAARLREPRPKAPCAATKVKTAWARTSPHLQWCDRGVDGPGAGDDGPPASAGLHTRHRRATPVRDLSTEAQAPVRDNHRGQGMGHLQVCTHVIGVPRPSAYNAARSPDPRKLLARPLQSKPRGLGRSPFPAYTAPMLINDQATSGSAPHRGRACPACLSVDSVCDGLTNSVWL
jgi:hypothetical protein